MHARGDQFVAMPAARIHRMMGATPCAGVACNGHCAMGEGLLHACCMHGLGFCMHAACMGWPCLRQRGYACTCMVSCHYVTDIQVLTARCDHGGIGEREAEIVALMKEGPHRGAIVRRFAPTE